MSVIEGGAGQGAGQGIGPDSDAVDTRRTADPPAATEELLYGVIRRLWPLHRTIVRAVERELEGTGMTAGEHALLDALRTHGPRTVPQLARSLGLDRQPVQRWVNHAADLGLVVTAPNPAHRRSSLIRLTDEGTEVMRGIQDAEAAELRRGLADLSPGEVRTALRVLDRLGEEFRHLADGSRVPPEESGNPEMPDAADQEAAQAAIPPAQGHRPPVPARPADRPTQTEGPAA
ncbi:MarR family winged helix-turn-helix transcriptional regulator [Streptomyces yunnanensis]|uniref:MarR family winged helix-turn-helix transcriptional regulator n=1 Tax=Streptomyces yunnanensis TaxID=156453 RepID=A0ABY8ACT7_9ACTN|nr:MarR family winged helix-turn-helix transcriptional regulator [Streptomyces yunnanensis]WEB42817.1 MarR family winged helix-turn-helix transcriptional regulator [Streptomyces yunnanensis]